MKKAVAIPALLAALPAGAHEAQYLTHAHAHPHGSEILVVAMTGLFFIGLAVWKSKSQS